MMRFISSVSATLGMTLCATQGWAEPAVTSPPPSHIVFVAHPHGNRLARHPVLPVLYLGCNSAPGSKNLVTFRLDGDGTVLTNTLRSFEDYFTDDGHNPSNTYSVLRPMVLPQEKTLLLAIYPGNYTLYHTNARHVAAIALDEQGQPTKLVKALRTTHPEAAIAYALTDLNARRLFLSYSSYWGWSALDKDSVPSSQFQMLPLPWNFWQFVFVPEWQRFYGVARGTDVCTFRLTTDGTGVEFFLMSTSATGTFGLFELNPALRKLYVLNGPDYKSLSIYSLARDGRFTGVPKIVPLGETLLIRTDSKARRLYSVTATGTIRSQPLDADGFPTGAPQVFQVSCGAVRDMMVDEPNGKVYIVCTEPPSPVK